MLGLFFPQVLFIENTCGEESEATKQIVNFLCYN